MDEYRFMINCHCWNALLIADGERVMMDASDTQKCQDEDCVSEEGIITAAATTSPTIKMVR